MFRNSERFGKNPNKITYFSTLNALGRLNNYGDLVFVNSNTDTFHEEISFETIDRWMDQLLSKFPMKQFQILTKRTNRMREYFETRDCLPNVWLGTSVEDQAHVFRIDTLRRVRSEGIKFVSFEPVIGLVEHANLQGVQWAIVGGESDFTSPRPMKKEWAEHLCFNIIKKQNVALFYKQNGGIGGSGAGGDIAPDGKRYHELPNYML